MKIFLCFCFFCISFSALAQQDSTKNNNSDKRDSIISARRDSAAIARRDLINTARRDSIVTSAGKELNLTKGKIEAVLTAFSQAADDISQIANNDELSHDEKSTQIKAIADQRDATLKSLVNENQLAKIKAYVIRRKIPKKID